MLQALQSIDKNFFLLINGRHSVVSDYIMWLASDRFIWIPLYLFCLWLLWKENRQGFWIILLAIAFMVTLSDQFCNLIKFSVLRIRPSNDPVLGPWVHIVNNYRGGTYGFYSAHASNSMAVVVFMFTILKNKPIYLRAILISFTLLISYSRVYLGVHYPGDVLTGMIMGSVIGYFSAILCIKVVNKWKARKNVGSAPGTISSD